MRLLLCLFVLWSTAPAAHLKKVREIPLANYLRLRVDLLGQADFAVRSVSFSPDERWLAIIVEQGRSIASLSGQTYLLVVGREQATGGLLLRAPIGRVPRAPGVFPELAWSPDSAYLAIPSAPPVVVRLKDTARCDLPAGSELGGFALPDRILVAANRQLISYNLACQPDSYRDVPEPVRFVRTHAGAGRIALSSANGVVILDAANGKQLRRWPGAPARDGHFAAGGTIYCQGRFAGKEEGGAECWNVESGTALAAITDVRGGSPFATADTAALAIFTNGTYSFDRFMETEKRGVRSLIALDLQDHKRVLEWRSPRASCNEGDPWSECKQPRPFALSSTGRYFAAAEAEQVRLYELTPK